MNDLFGGRNVTLSSRRGPRDVPMPIYYPTFVGLTSELACSLNHGATMHSRKLVFIKAVET